MLLAGPIATLRSKLTEKVKYRPTAAIEPLLPAGTDALDDLPEVRPGVAAYDLVRSEPTSEELAAYGANIKVQAHGGGLCEVAGEAGQACRARHVHGSPRTCSCRASAHMSSSTVRCVMIGRMGHGASRARQCVLASAHAYACVAPLARCIIVRGRRKGARAAWVCQAGDAQVRSMWWHGGPVRQEKYHHRKPHLVLMGAFGGQFKALHRLRRRRQTVTDVPMSPRPGQNRSNTCCNT